MSNRYTHIARYRQALVDYATQLDDVTPLEELRDLLAAKLVTGNTKELIIAAPGGKTFEFEITMTTHEQFAAVVEAIKHFNDEAGDGPVTFLDFSRA